MSKHNLHTAHKNHNYDSQFTPRRRWEDVATHNGL